MAELKPCPFEDKCAVKTNPLLSWDSGRLCALCRAKQQGFNV